MTALRMDGTTRPKPDAATLVRKMIRSWFKSNPRSIVSFHWRWDDLPASSREMLSMPRTAIVYRNRIVFGPYQSEMSLSNIFDCHITEDARLQLYFDGQDGVAVEYTAVVETLGSCGVSP